MEKFIKLLYYYLLSALVLFTVYLTIALALSPKNDSQRRGFIPCTEEFIVNVSVCDRGQVVCPAKWLWQDMKCNINVVMEGLGAWVRGQQKTPWANYIFEDNTSIDAVGSEKYFGVSGFEDKELSIEKELIEGDKEKQNRLNIADRFDGNDEAIKSNKQNNNEEVDFSTVDEVIADEN